MAKIRMIVIEGEMTPDETIKLAKAFSTGDEAFTSIQLPNGVTGQVASLAKSEEHPRPRPIAVPAVEKSEPVAVPVVEAPAPVVEIPPAIAKVFPEAVIETEQETASVSLLEDLLGCKRLVGILERLQQDGHKELPALIEACKSYREQVPMLQRLGDGLDDRVTRTFEGMK